MATESSPKCFGYMGQTMADGYKPDAYSCAICSFVTLCGTETSNNLKRELEKKLEEGWPRG